MCRNYIYWATEFLNYWSLAFCGLKLFVPQYGARVSKKVRNQNFLFFMASIVIAVICAGNCKYVGYSNVVTYVFVVYVYFYLKIYTKGCVQKLFSLIVIYTNTMRLIDLWVVAVITEVNRVSRYVEVDIIHMGLGRSIFMILLSVCYYLISYLLSGSLFLEYLCENTFYRWVLCIYSFLGIISFYRVYHFDYNAQLLQYWIFYLVFAFVVGGTFLLYLIRIKVREREEILNTRNDMMEANYQGLEKAYAENQMLYHDYKNHMLSVRQLIKEYRREDALEYIDAYISLTAKVNRRINSGSKILDIIVNSKFGEAKAKNIDFTCDVGYVGDTGITDIDMCALMANLLDNAIEACERIEGERAWICLKIVRRNDMLLIKLGNSIAAADALKRDFFQSKKDKQKIHGWGMKSVEKVLKKYDGSKEHYIGEKEFEIFINIPVEEISEDKNIQLEDRK